MLSKLVKKKMRTNIAFVWKMEVDRAKIRL
jgi:hypothetical protein